MSERALVVVAEDDEDILRLVTRRLERDGYEVRQARDGAQALGAARDHRPALVLLDVSMPVLDGLEVLRRIRGDESLAGIRVVLLTAMAQEQDVRRAFEAGADGYIRKPFGLTELSAKVAQVLGQPAGS
ncbi:MAG TPA: response regulator [Gaiellaceae bacterium]|nr:response regulator [Gaiellaceae bacterium]